MIDYGYGILLSKDINKWSALDCRNDVKIRTWCRENDEISDTQQDNWLKKIENDNSLRMYSIYPYIDYKNIDSVGEPFNKFLGVCGLTNISWIHRTAEWSLYIDPNVQGKGYAQASLKTLIYHGFEAFDLRVIWGECFSNNEVVLHIAEKLGFKEEGTLRKRYHKNGEYIDTKIVSLLRDEWKPW